MDLSSREGKINWLRCYLLNLSCFCQIINKMKTTTHMTQNSFVLRTPSLAPSQYQLESVLYYVE